MTLLEQLTVTFLVGILSAIAVPGWLGFASAQQIKVDADQTQIFLRGTQSQAKKLTSVKPSVIALNPKVVFNLPEQDLTQHLPMFKILRPTLTEPPLVQYPAILKLNDAMGKAGSLSPLTILPGFPTPLEVSVYPTLALTDTTGSLFQRYSALPGSPSLLTAPPEPDQVPHRGMGRRYASAKKPAKNKLVVTGCFQANGLFLMSSGSSFTQVNWSTLPANTTINVKAPLCQGTGVSQ